MRPVRSTARPSPGPARACQVTGPAIPSASSSCERWNASKRRLGAGPKRPSISRREAGLSRSRFCSSSTSVPMGTAAQNRYHLDSTKLRTMNPIT